MDQAVVYPGLTAADVLSILAGQSLGDVGTFTLSSLPDPTVTARRTCWVTDLFGVGGRMVSEGGFWKPIRPLLAGNTTVANMTTTPFVTPPTLILTNAGLLGLGITMNVTLGMGTGFAVPSPGYRQRVVRPAGALGTLNVIGALTKALTGWADFEFDGSAWQQTASGGLL